MRDPRNLLPGVLLVNNAYPDGSLAPRAADTESVARYGWAEANAHSLVDSFDAEVADSDVNRRYIFRTLVADTPQRKDHRGVE